MFSLVLVYILGEIFLSYFLRQTGKRLRKRIQTQSLEDVVCTPFYSDLMSIYYVHTVVVVS